MAEQQSITRRAFLGGSASPALLAALWQRAPGYLATAASHTHTRGILLWLP